MKRQILGLAGLLMLAVAAFGQQGDIRGFVYDIESGEPVIFANVVIAGTTTGSATDINGFFSIPQVDAGSFQLMVTSIEYDTLIEPVTVTANQITNVKLYAREASRQLQTVTVTAQTQAKLTEVRISTIPITPKQIERLPSIGGEPDLAQYLQVLPGVIFTGDQGGQLYIRGGSPIQNKVLLDGMVVYNPFHSIGLFSVFETDIIRSVDVYTGGFSAEYGDRVSAVIDITTRDGNKKEFGGEVSVSPFMARTLLEGPIKKLDESGSSVSYLLTAKHSYLDKTSTALYPYINGGDGIPYQFTDLYGKVSVNSNTGNKINFFGFNFRDSVSFSDVTTFNWNSTGAGANFVVVPAESNVLIEGIFAYSNYAVTQNEADERPRNSLISGFNGGVDFTYYIPDGDVKYGVEVVGFQTDYNFYNRLGLRYQQQQYTTQLSAFVKYRKVISKRLVIDPSVRIQYYASLGEISPEPRLGLKYNLTSRIRLKFAGGLYSQNLISTRSDRDVVNLFSGFLSGPESILATPDGEDATTKLQKATHAIGGIEFDVTDYIEFNVEPYIKYFNQLIEINRNKIVPQDPDFATETGKAYGIDFLLKYDYKRLYIWLGYSLGYINRYDGEQTYPTHYDRRHNMNVVTTYTFGEDQSWEVSGRWNLGSGFPFTQTAGFYESIDFLDGINTDYTTTNGNLGIIYADDLNGGRLPYYHRLDVSVRKWKEFASGNKLNIVGSVTNVYNRENIFYFDRIRYERVDQLPILPSLSVSYTF
ncbi:MAG: carboxypeptidase-like regulatory domain-containing protein [Chitinophagales bacterium]|nr:carboxypeptidase-like regulatory domain-containing protein [Chitinophagales bacterium]HAE13778.1 TonB-dependent receptor [Bacteroidota bacterium]MCB9019967.1 carboxypeptidase-like regulatory domain-containing protein [Chitinophagales bacterium]MCB9022651.1 carboxypeptidase-like regulatory domain-containing protein [Chitinophagales bacterium]MCB9032091.1 carboxypeptidase-like regulatory domain-containing protein [Chitinophagales bacterium]